MSNLSSLAQSTFEIHYYVDLVGIEELVIPNVAFPLEEIEHCAEHILFDHPWHHVAHHCYQPMTYTDLQNAPAFCLVGLGQAFSG